MGALNVCARILIYTYRHVLHSTLTVQNTYKPFEDTVTHEGLWENGCHVIVDANMLLSSHSTTHTT